MSLRRASFGWHAGRDLLHDERGRIGRFRACLCLLIGALPFFVAGCAREGTIEVDASSRPVRFTIHHRGWPQPFVWPQVTEFAIAATGDELFWQVQSESGSGPPAKRLEIVYGRVPPGFVQVYPKDGTAAKPLSPGRTYYVAAGGRDAVYKAAFALPQPGWTIQYPQVTAGSTSRPASQPTPPVEEPPK